MIKVISFDIGGTLIKQNTKTSSKYDIKSLSNLLNLPYDDVRNAYKSVFQKMNKDFESLVTIFFQKLNINKTEEIINFFKEKFDDENVGNNIDDNDIAVIKKLKEQGYKIILFSNSCCLIKNNISDELKNLVDDIFYSYDIGYTKNEKESYEYIEKKLGYKKCEFLHIGDTLKSDYLSPIQNGWNALYFGSTNDDNIDSIKSLKKIFKYL